MTQQLPSPSNESTWEICPQGEIQQLVNGLKSRRKQQQWQQAAVIGGAMMVLLAVGSWLGPHLDGVAKEPNFGGIVCSEVQANMQAYTAKTLETSLAEKITNHLSQCAHCREKLEEMNPARSPAVVSLQNGGDAELTRRLRNVDWSSSLASR